MMKTILTATDGSEHAGKALDLAADFAKKYEAQLIIVHAIGQGSVPDELAHMAEIEHMVEPPPKDTSLPRAAVLTNAADRALRNHEVHASIGRKLLEQAEKAARDQGVKKVEKVLLDGDPAACILDTAADKNADMIVMGSRGLGNLRGLLVGSVSNKVNHLAKCTCVCVK